MDEKHSNPKTLVEKLPEALKQKQQYPHINNNLINPINNTINESSAAVQTVKCYESKTNITEKKILLLKSLHQTITLIKHRTFIQCQPQYKMHRIITVKMFMQKKNSETSQDQIFKKK
jgi:hypothetical protein